MLTVARAGNSLDGTPSLWYPIVLSPCLLFLSVYRHSLRSIRKDCFISPRVRCCCLRLTCPSPRIGASVAPLCGRCKISLTGSYELLPYCPMIKHDLHNTMNSTVQFVSSLYSNVDVDVRNICCFHSSPCLLIKRHNGIPCVSHNRFIVFNFVFYPFTHFI